MNVDKNTGCGCDRTRVRAGLNVIIHWLLASAIGLLIWPASVVYWIIYCYRRSWKLIVLCPPVIFMILAFANGILAYASGTARIHGYGLPGPTHGNAVHGPHCRRRNHGCIPSIGIPRWTVAGNNAGVMVMSEWFGPMPGVYGGYYPTAVEAYDRLANASDTVTPDQLDAGPFTVNGREITLAPSFRGKRPWIWHNPPEYYRAELIDDRLLVIGAPMKHFRGDFHVEDIFQDDFAPIFMIDIERSELFAMYTPWCIMLDMVERWKRRTAAIQRDDPG